MTTDILEYSKFVSLHLSGSSPTTLAKQVEAVAGPGAREKIATHFRDLCRRTGVAMWIAVIHTDDAIPLHDTVVPILRTIFQNSSPSDRLKTMVQAFVPVTSAHRATLLNQIEYSNIHKKHHYIRVALAVCTTGLDNRAQYGQRARHLSMIGETEVSKRMISKRAENSQRAGSAKSMNKLRNDSRPRRSPHGKESLIAASGHETITLENRTPTSLGTKRAASVLIRNTQLAQLRQVLNSCTAIRFDADTRFLSQELTIHNRWRIIFESKISLSNQKVDFSWSGVDVQVTGNFLQIEYLPAPSSKAPQNVRLELNLRGAKKMPAKSLSEQLAVGMLVFVFAEPQGIRTTSAETDLALCRKWFEPYELELSASYKLSSQPSIESIRRVTSLRIPQHGKKPSPPRKPHAVRGHVRKVNGTEIRVRAHKRKK